MDRDEPAGLTTQEGWVDTSDRHRIAWRQYSCPGRSRVVIVCPGFFQSKDTRTFRRLCEMVATRFDVLAMDFRGHGRSTGLYTFSARESQDLNAVLDLARSRYARIGVMGFSLGAAIAINTISRRRGDVVCLAAVSGPSDFGRIEFQAWTPEAMRTGWQGLERGAGCRPGNPWLAKDRPMERLAACEGVPIHIIHGTRDVIVGVRHAHRLHEAARSPKQLTIVPGGSHAEALFRDDPAGFEAIVGPWLSAALGVS